MLRRTDITILNALALLGLIGGCSRPKENQGVEQAAPAPEVTEGHAGSHDSHGGGHSRGGAGDKHGPGMASHGEDNQRQERAQQRLGEEVMDIALSDNTGKAFRLGALRRTEETKGRIAVLTFWCTTCHSCRAIEKGFDKKAKQYEGQGVEFLAVDSNFTDNAQRVTRFLEEHDLSFSVLMDSESDIARYFGAKLTTTTAVIDADGRLRYYGGFGGAEDAVRNILAGEKVAVPESRGAG